ncbi:aspartate aminotransferase family protein [Maribacter sp. Asnod1-A12]|uniref:aspartate aminotransferase family protein n=1 Tax=Maribacter sp. Asnod1-A12 TaxID=3160576 RepID=UPI00386CC265
MSTIKLKTTIPGPKSEAILERRKASMPAGLGKLSNVVVEKSEGALIWDVDGNQLIDFAGGIGVLNAGHRPKEVVDAIKKQVDKSIHSCILVCTNEPAVELCEKLNEITPGVFPKKTLLANSGAEAVDNAVNIARYYTKRAGVIVFEGGYHGRSYLTMSMTSKYGLFKKGYGSMASDIYRLPAPNMYRPFEGMTEEQYLDHCIKQLDHAMISQISPEDIAAIVIEPVQGEGGFVPMPTAFLQKIRSICDANGIVMIADEIQSGFGRTGKMFAIEHATGVVPDMITMAKSMGSGMPISAITGKSEILDTPHPGAVGGTYGANPVASAAALATIDIINTPSFLNRANEIAQIMRIKMELWQTNNKFIGDVRGLGAMQVIEFVKDKTTKEPNPELTQAILVEALSKGLVVIRAGLFSNCIRLLVPFSITDEQLEDGMVVLQNAIDKIAK